MAPIRFRYDYDETTIWIKWAGSETSSLKKEKANRLDTLLDFINFIHCSVIIGRNPTEAKGKSDVTPYTGKSFSLYFKFV